MASRFKAACVLSLLASGCAQGYLSTAPDLQPRDCTTDTPVLAPVAATLTMPSPWRAPYRRQLIISDRFPPDRQEAIAKALEASRELTQGLVDVVPIIGETTCGQPNALHAAAPGECWLDVDDDGFNFAFHSGDGAISMLLDDRVLPLEWTYHGLVHEIGHVLGLSHSDGFMHPSVNLHDGDYLDVHHYDELAAGQTWDRTALPSTRVELTLEDM